jgi:glycosyltransferase involved in cell wall biosynthesis
MFEQIGRSHDVTVICFRPRDAADQDIARMSEWARRVETVPWRSGDHFTARFYVDVIASLPTGLPYTVRKYRSRALQQRIRAAVTEHDFDIVVCDFLQPAINCLSLRFQPKVLFQHNVEAEIFKRHASSASGSAARLLYWWEYVKLAHFECRAVGAFDCSIAVSQRDALLLAESCGVDRVFSIPTGVDTRYFTPQPHREKTHTIAFVGSMDWLPNQDAVEFFIREIWPRITARVEDARLLVVGRNPPAALQRLAAATAGISVTGTVEDVRPFMAEAALIVIPLRIGGGTRIKAYEAMAMGRAVLSTTIGAEGLPVVDGEHLVLADGAIEFAERATELLHDRVARARLGSAARQFVTSHGSWAHAAEAFCDICERVVRETKETTPCE